MFFYVGFLEKPFKLFRSLETGMPNKDAILFACPQMSGIAPVPHVMKLGKGNNYQFVVNSC